MDTEIKLLLNIYHLFFVQILINGTATSETPLFRVGAKRKNSHQKFSPGMTVMLQRAILKNHHGWR
jgi:hypothetical protein